MTELDLFIKILNAFDPTNFLIENFSNTYAAFLDIYRSLRLCRAHTHIRRRFSRMVPQTARSMSFSYMNNLFFVYQLSRHVFDFY